MGEDPQEFTDDFGIPFGREQNLQAVAQSFGDPQPVDGMLCSPSRAEALLTRATFENFLNESPRENRLCETNYPRVYENNLIHAHFFPE